MDAKLVGKQIAHYLVIERLGAGGMGVVYKARDTHLDRFVALKVLPAERVADPERKRRFVLEAKSASSLNHPNIVHIYDIASVDGLDYIAMELVDGNTLGDVIGKPGLRTDQVLRYGLQIADALAKSHAAGIIHRDLKPNNIMVTGAGLVKVLDFGLAKLAESSTDEFAATRTAAGHTEEGMIVGTVAYMSPEQAQGKPVDARSDVFSLGAVLYEMAAGKQAFARDSRLDTLTAILRDPPAPLPMTVPAGLRSVIQRCLVKEAAQRYQQASEVRASLEVIQDTSSDQIGAPESGIRRAAPAESRRRFAVIGAAALAVTLLLAAFLWVRKPVRPPELTAQRLISTFSGFHRSPSFSPDGSMIVYINAVNSVPQVWIKNLAQGDPVQITKGEVPAGRPRWSPKNDQIVFNRLQEIWSVPPLGGSAKRIVDSGRNPNFSSDGERMVYERGKDIWVAAADGSGAHRVDGPPENRHNSMDGLPAFSPDGKWIASFRPEIGPHGDIWVLPAEGGKARRLTFDTRIASGPTWTPDGRWIVFSSSRAGSTTLWRVPADGGTPEPLTTGAGEDAEPALSPDGKRLIYTNARNTWALSLLDPVSGNSKDLLERRTEVIWPVFSRAGDRIAFFHVMAVGEQVGDQVFTVAVDGSDLRQMTYGKGERNVMPSWSADGSSLYFFHVWPTTSFRKISLAGGAAVDFAPWSAATYNSVEEDPTGRQLVYTLLDGPRPNATVIRDLVSGQEKRLATPLHDPRWSPDRRSIAGEQQNGQMAICPASGGNCTSLTKGSHPAWDASGTKIYFIRVGDSRSKPQELFLIDLKTRTEQKVATVGPFKPIDISFDLSRSGQIITAPFREGRSELWLADIKQ